MVNNEVNYYKIKLDSITIFIRKVVYVGIDRHFFMLKDECLGL